MEDNTRYHVTTPNSSQDDANKQKKRRKWIHIAFDPQYDTSITHYNRALSNERIEKQQKQQSTQSASLNAEASSNDNNPPEEEISESVLQYQCQMRKLQAADRASKTNVNASQHLHTIYNDEHIVVANKPSGILCVPGVNKNKSLLDLVFETYGVSEEELKAIIAADEQRKNEGKKKSRASKKRKKNGDTDTPPDFSAVRRDNMIVHRLDMDTRIRVV